MTDEGKAVDLSPEERADIDGMFLRLANTSHYELLGVKTDADRKAIRDAYFALSQRFHPDAWFGKSTGEWKGRMEAIFREVTKAYDVLSNRNQRAAYDASIGIAARPAVPGENTGRHSVVSAEPRVTADRLSQPKSPSQPEAPLASAAPAAPSRPTTAPWWEAKNDTESVVVPDRSAPPRMSRAPQTPTASMAPPPSIDPETARRAAREALARKLGGHGGPAVQTGRYPTSSTDPARRTASGATISTSTLASLQNARAQRLDSERVSRLDHYLRLADESVQRNDPLGASNALQLALSIAPEDEALRVRAQAAAFKAAESMAEKYIEQARQHEMQGRFDLAAEMWQRAAVGRPKDHTLLLRAASVLLRGGKELQKAADLARRATLLVPKGEAWALLGDIYLAAGMKASAQAAADTAAKLDPTSSVVKDLLVRLKS